MTSDFRCGRPTATTGQPCRTVIHASNPACKLHLRAGDEEWAAKLSERWTGGIEWGKELSEFQVAQLRQRIAELEDLAARPKPRRYEDNGAQVVEVAGRYSFRWTGDEALVPGDLVEVPGSADSFYGSRPWAARVTGLGTTYTGSLATITRRLPNPDAERVAQ